MNLQLSTRFAAFGLALIVTLGMLGGIQQLATTPGHDAAQLMANSDATTLRIVIVGHRVPLI